MVYSALFYYVFISCLAMALACSPYHRCSTQSSDTAWHFGDYHHKKLRTKAVPVGDSSLQMSIFAQPWVWQALLSFHHSANHTHPHLFSN
jgi:hypothetical protein